MTRRESVGCIGVALGSAISLMGVGKAPRLAPGAPNSPERKALVTALREKLGAVTPRFEARVHSGAEGKRMPYRLFRATGTAGKVPLVVYLHGSGGLGDDNRKQLAGGNLFGSHLWALPENQKKHPCFIVAPQTSFGWIRYDAERTAGGPRPNPVAGFGLGARMVVEIVDALRKEFSIDEQRLYVMGNSMGGGGTWHLLAHRPGMFAAAIPVAGGKTSDDVRNLVGVPLWNFHGDADETVPVEVSRERIAALRKAGGKPVHTEYPGVGHNVNEWAFSESAVVEWLFAQKRRG
ncbi:MAG: prolyl oligopeptidase family serine peptidase [Acidobacteria bacterium]|nr:prolyl oligopeptidase family serine peptidase [Acidobacteriota bacterium]